MRITFRVDQAIRGVIQEQTFVLNEWAGVWVAGESYRRGERVLLFLYRPGKLGLTSPVGGQQGRFKLDSNGMAVLRQEQAAVWLPERIYTVPGTTRMRVLIWRALFIGWKRNRDARYLLLLAPDYFC